MDRCHLSEIITEKIYVIYRIHNLVKENTSITLPYVSMRKLNIGEKQICFVNIFQKQHT